MFDFEDVENRQKFCEHFENPYKIENSSFLKVYD